MADITPNRRSAVTRTDTSRLCDKDEVISVIYEEFDQSEFGQQIDRESI